MANFNVQEFGPDVQGFGPAQGDDGQTQYTVPHQGAWPAQVPVLQISPDDDWEDANTGIMMVPERVSVNALARCLLDCCWFVFV